ncbi:hypothetical protein P7C73_g5160, partial [Tremellales sp. Uapishka_1]
MNSANQSYHTVEQLYLPHARSAGSVASSNHSKDPSAPSLSRMTLPGSPALPSDFDLDALMSEPPQTDTFVPGSGHNNLAPLDNWTWDPPIFHPAPNPSLNDAHHLPLGNPSSTIPQTTTRSEAERTTSNSVTVVDRTLLDMLFKVTTTLHEQRTEAEVASELQNTRWMHLLRGITNLMAATTDNSNEIESLRAEVGELKELITALSANLSSKDVQDSNAMGKYMDTHHAYPRHE